MTGIFAVIMTAYNADTPLKAALYNGLHLMEPLEAENVKPPYGVFESPGNVPLITAGEIKINQPGIVFKLYSAKRSATEITTMYQALIAVYDGYRGTADGLTYSLQNIHELPLKPDGMWQFIVEYKSHVVTT